MCALYVYVFVCLFVFVVVINYSVGRKAEGHFKDIPRDLYEARAEASEHTSNCENAAGSYWSEKIETGDILYA